METLYQCSLTKRLQQILQGAWDNALLGSVVGSNSCPTCGKDVHVAPKKGIPRDRDIDQRPAWSKWDLTDMAREDVLSNYNIGTGLECVSCNRGRGARDPE